jgi:hypothetical protein
MKALKVIIPLFLIVLDISSQEGITELCREITKLNSELKSVLVSGFQDMTSNLKDVKNGLTSLETKFQRLSEENASTRECLQLLNEGQLRKVLATQITLENLSEIRSKCSMYESKSGFFPQEIVELLFSKSKECREFESRYTPKKEVDKILQYDV